MRQKESWYPRLLPVMLLALCGVAAHAPAAAQQAPTRIAGIVTHVADGDTLDVTANGRAYTIRLDGIDAPEAGQAFSQQARQQLRVLTFSQPATVIVTDHDRYGRVVGRVFVAGADVGEEMVRKGLAWHYTQYSSDPRLAALEQQARQQHRGLWADSKAIAPWQYRSDRAGRPAAPPPPHPQPAPSPTGPYHGNVSSRVFHAAGCPDYDCKHCTQGFATRAAAEAAGYRAHRACVEGRR